MQTTVVWRGIPSQKWESYFQGLKFSYTNDQETIMVGEIIDNAALHGVLNRI